MHGVSGCGGSHELFSKRFHLHVLFWGLHHLECYFNTLKVIYQDKYRSSMGGYQTSQCRKVNEVHWLSSQTIKSRKYSDHKRYQMHKNSRKNHWYSNNQ
jgi:hypothetical protein